MAECITPFSVRNKMTNCTIPVPCGKCPECLKRRVSAWSFRLMEEEKNSTSAHFITLTYDTKHVPISRNGFMTLCKDDVQKFFKRLRKASALISEVSIKYYLCGEYGGRTKRPHYHAIVFNVPSQMLIERSWMLGTIDYGTVSGASVGYTLKYMHKRKMIPQHKNDDRSMEFSLMSKGIGESYITPKTERYHKADLVNRMCLTIENGKKIAMPRYYKDKIYTESQRVQIASWAKQKSEQTAEKIQRAYRGKNYVWDKTEADLQSFRKQDSSSLKRDKL